MWHVQLRKAVGAAAVGFTLLAVTPVNAMAQATEPAGPVGTQPGDMDDDGFDWGLLGLLGLAGLLGLRRRDDEVVRTETRRP